MNREEDIRNKLRDYLDLLVMHASGIGPIGLYYGKMGIALCLLEGSHYFHGDGGDYYEIVARQLINDTWHAPTGSWIVQVSPNIYTFDYVRKIIYNFSRNN